MHTQFLAVALVGTSRSITLLHITIAGVLAVLVLFLFWARRSDRPGPRWAYGWVEWSRRRGRHRNARRL
jgi:hypothetical protein